MESRTTVGSGNGMLHIGQQSIHLGWALSAIEGIKPSDMYHSVAPIGKG